MPLLRPRVFGNDATPRSTVPIAAPPDQNVIAVVVRWIPVEVITAYKAITGQVPATSSTIHFWFAVAFVVITFLWIIFATHDADKAIAWRQAIVSAFAFVFWAAGTENQDIMLAIFSWWQQWMAFVSLALASVALPLVDRILKVLGVPQD